MKNKTTNKSRSFQSVRNFMYEKIALPRLEDFNFKGFDKPTAKLLVGCINETLVKALKITQIKETTYEEAYWLVLLPLNELLIRYPRLNESGMLFVVSDFWALNGNPGMAHYVLFHGDIFTLYQQRADCEEMKDWTII